MDTNNLFYFLVMNCQQQNIAPLIALKNMSNDQNLLKIFGFSISGCSFKYLIFCNILYLSCGSVPPIEYTLEA
jgi:hypothetical protein